MTVEVVIRLVAGSLALSIDGPAGQRQPHVGYAGWRSSRHRSTGWRPGCAYCSKANPAIPNIEGSSQRIPTHLSAFPAAAVTLLTGWDRADPIAALVPSDLITGSADPLRG